LSRQDKQRLLTLTSNPSNNVYDDLVSVGRAATLDKLLLNIVRTGLPTTEAIRLAQNWDQRSFPLKGRDLMNLGLEEGSKIGDILAKVKNWWIKNCCEPDKKSCLEFAQECLRAGPGTKLN
jgi:tRNA nucleotidyltransferase/poly(A) polymerase